MVWKLKEKGVEVYFQKEKIYTLDSKGELAGHHHILSGTGRVPLHFRERDMGNGSGLRTARSA